MCEDFDPDYIDVGPKVLRQSKHVARKSHQCSGCEFGGIMAGEEYTLLVTLDGSEFKLERYCSHREFDNSMRGCRRNTDALQHMLQAQNEAYEDMAWRERVGP